MKLCEFEGCEFIASIGCNYCVDHVYISERDQKNRRDKPVYSDRHVELTPEFVLAATVASLE